MVFIFRVCEKTYLIKILKRRSIVRKVISVLLTSIVALCLSGNVYAVKKNQSKVIKIGVAGPHTGANAAFGEQLWRGSQKAAEDLNKAGGINGRKIVLVKADDACEPKQAVNVANRLVELDKVDAVIGHFCSSSTIPSSAVYDDAGILMITPASTNPKVTEQKFPTIMRMCGRDDQQGFTAAEFMVKKLKLKTIAVVHDKDTYGQGLADATKLRMRQLGVREVLYEGLTRGEKDFNALVTKIKATRAQVVYFGGLHSEAGPLVRQMREQGLDTLLISGDGIVSTDFVVAAGGNKYTNGVYMTFGRDARKLESGKRVVGEFRKSGYEPEGYTLYSYATMQVIAAAIKATGTTDGVKLSKWLRKNAVQTVMGPKSWDKKGDLKESDYVMYKWNDKGNYAEVTI